MRDIPWYMSDYFTRVFFGNSNSVFIMTDACFTKCLQLLSYRRSPTDTVDMVASYAAVYEKMICHLGLPLMLLHCKFGAVSSENLQGLRTYLYALIDRL